MATPGLQRMGRLLKDLRVRSGVTQREMARRLRVGRGRISAIENQRDVTLDVADVWVAALDQDPKLVLPVSHGGLTDVEREEELQNRREREERAEQEARERQRLQAEEEARRARQEQELLSRMEIEGVYCVYYQARLKRGACNLSENDLWRDWRSFEKTYSRYFPVRSEREPEPSFEGLVEFLALYRGHRPALVSHVSGAIYTDLELREHPQL
jgi:transcriptional regulator with XRE-family HTH domain